MRKVRVEDAVGMVLCHDITKIVPGEFKGVAFKKGHIIQEEDIPELLKIGKEHIYVWETREGLVHENEAALRLARAVCKGKLEITEPREGKVNLIAHQDGLLKVHVNCLNRVNCFDWLAVATLHSNRVVRKGDLVAGVRVIPLVVEEAKIEQVEALCNEAKEGIIEVKPLLPLKAGLVTTGNEVFYGRIRDKFGPVLKEKLARYGCKFLRQIIVPDDIGEIATAVKKLAAEGAQLILTSGGMSVDPDDVTPAGVRAAGGEIVAYGAPVLPGSMFMLAYLEDIPVLGLPGCVMYNKTTVFDLVLPRILAGEKLTRQDIAFMGHGGLCNNCPNCTFPHCPFGKGS
ncbi:molybdopterin-binding protein [Calderihabitans maritimus]|uniref:Molybdopterin molybdenumtransferase n=1 Tax=Calderihabitans maritimus TaxID=1246530 RepID=A0A1Z5HR75_9FIRM|nr:molybdopterin-binding protein [Calderihabitans maritimus]GAW92032.1 molybdopterin biosynthesis enzyme [Calderihabitans maritimus]